TQPPPVERAPAAPTTPYSTDDLLQQLRPQARMKAQTGWRTLLGLGPSKKERLLLADQTDVRTTFPRAVTVMVANPKGGGGKTPTSLVIAGEMGNARGGGVVVWDNNELRGNARDRSYFPHRRSVADLLDAADALERPDASFTELGFFLAHQTHGKYYVLSSDPAGRAVMDQEQVRRVHRILARFFEVIVIDTGNNEKAPNWLAARDLADCLVVPMKWRQDSILVANRMLATMAEESSPLLQRTVLVGTNGPGDSQRDARAAVYARFSGAHNITEIKTDPHIHAGAIIDRRQLTPRTQRAGLQTAAIVARLFKEATGQ
ncbi:MAG: chromosome partitioning protein, partial [Microlunatus sp.]|nr:chromosome partitioning protein [Microlunatus sp.]